MQRAILTHEIGRFISSWKASLESKSSSLTLRNYFNYAQIFAYLIDITSFMADWNDFDKKKLDFTNVPEISRWVSRSYILNISKTENINLTKNTRELESYRI